MQDIGVRAITPWEIWDKELELQSGGRLHEHALLTLMWTDDK